jgi:hypothetical protein
MFAFVLLAAHPAAAQGGGQASAAPADSLRSLLTPAFGAPTKIAVNLGSRVSLTFRDAAWLNTAPEPAFARAFEAARVAWLKYGMAAGVDTVSVAVEGSAPGTLPTANRVEYFFYPTQLSASSPPRFDRRR